MLLKSKIYNHVILSQQMNFNCTVYVAFSVVLNIFQSKVDFDTAIKY